MLLIQFTSFIAVRLISMVLDVRAPWEGRHTDCNLEAPDLDPLHRP